MILPGTQRRALLVTWRLSQLPLQRSVSTSPAATATASGGGGDVRLRRAVLGGASAFVFLAGTYAAFHVARVWRLPASAPDAHEPAVQAAQVAAAADGAGGGAAPELTIASFDGMAGEYDDAVGWDEWLMGLHRRRREVAGLAKGRVLEVAAGTGRNLEFYRGREGEIEHLTVTDSSEAMLRRAYARVAGGKGKGKNNGKGGSGLEGMPPLRFSLVDVVALGKRLEEQKGQSGTALGEAGFRRDAGPELLQQKQRRSGQEEEVVGGFDTVVDTFGLCSMSDPVSGLRGMAGLLRPGGQLVLLEHGRIGGHGGFAAWWPLGRAASLVNEALDRTAPGHARRWGCWWNRDVEELVARAGLRAKRVRRFHFGTTVLVEAVVAEPAERQPDK
ncbi:hypothetical protein HK405_014256 [Cladochytrium tenue]|nr:hypothetical protein HK405_014256 [Cladochytrium tenue]